MKLQDQDVIPAAIRLKRLYCDRVEFAQALLPIEEDFAGGSPRVREFGIRLEVQGDGSQESPFSVRLSVECEPDAESNQPFRIKVSYVAEFFLDGDWTDETREVYARANCAAILFPYLRQTLTDLTSRGVGGPLTLPVLNLARTLRPAEAGTEDSSSRIERGSSMDQSPKGESGET